MGHKVVQHQAEIALAWVDLAPYKDGSNYWDEGGSKNGTIKSSPYIPGLRRNIMYSRREPAPSGSMSVVEVCA